MMETVKFDRSELLKIYNSANDEVKRILEDKMGSDSLKLKIEDRINSVEDACKENGTTWEEELPFKNPKNDEQNCVNAFASLIQLIKAYNQGKKKDWKNCNQYKYYPWWRMDGKSGSGLSFYDTAYDYSDSGVASRLCLLDESHVEIVAKKFPDLYEAFMTE